MTILFDVNYKPSNYKINQIEIGLFFDRMSAFEVNTKSFVMFKHFCCWFNHNTIFINHIYIILVCNSLHLAFNLNKSMFIRSGNQIRRDICSGANSMEKCTVGLTISIANESFSMNSCHCDYYYYLSMRKSVVLHKP